MAHGGPLLDSGIETVNRFEQQLAAWSLSLSLEGILDGKTIEAAHNDNKLADDTWRSSLGTASDVTDALFGH
jgi:hypothetical protein